MAIEHKKLALAVADIRAIEAEVQAQCGYQSDRTRAIVHDVTLLLGLREIADALYRTES